MKKIYSYVFLIITMFLFNIIEVNAFSSDDYRTRQLCGNFELAAFKKDGSIETISCHNSFSEAKEAMVKDGNDDLAIMTNVNGNAKILDANLALLDLSVNPTAITNFYRTSDMNTYRYTYMDTGSLYGGVDGALIETVFSTKGVWAALVRIGNQTGWISQEAYEVVPLSWVKSVSSYTVTNDYIRHNYVAKIQEVYNGSAGSTIGPKPEMLSPGTYYSYDGHYFYDDLKKLIKDYQNHTYNSSVNKNKPYYNYYMYLSNHTRTTYSSLNIDEYIRNNLNIHEDAYGNSSINNSSRLYGKGQFFYHAQEKYGANALLALSLSRNETANGRSNLAIVKNNGFGLNAVDSNPGELAYNYASFTSSILGYASKYITYGYAHPRDWRYFGPQFGDKGLGMNVNYASDTYWSEKMAANYYSFDKAKGLQDYNFYQLGVVTKPIDAMSDANTGSTRIYTYPEAEDAVVIIGEKEGEEVDGSKKWYKIVSDLNIDSSFNEITSGNYNWNSYAYIPSSAVKMINTGKNGYISPNEVTEYIDHNYEYDIYYKEKEMTPKVAIITKNTPLYYDSAKQEKQGNSLLQGKYVMVYMAALQNNTPVSYLVTSDYFHDQKHWVSADSIDFVTSKYAKVTVSVSGNQYTWVNSKPKDTKETLISGLYTASYVPVLEEKQEDELLWYKVPVSLTTTSNEFGWTLASAPGVNLNLSTYVVENTAPVINAVDKKIIQGAELNELEGVSATDKEDGDLTKRIVVESSNVDIDKVGKYTITYKVTDSANKSTTKTINVTVIENAKPVINATDKTITKGIAFDSLKDVTATDEEDGTIKKIEVVENTVDINTIGTYKVTYKVSDSYNQTVTKSIKVTVVENQLPIINATDQKIYQNIPFEPLDNVEAMDPEDGPITKIEVIENTVDISKVGEYKVTYKVTDKANQSVTKTIKVTVVEKKLTKKDGEFYLNSLTFNKNTKKYTISGYLIILNTNNNDKNPIYTLILKDKNSSKEYPINISSWTQKVPYNLGSENGYDYNTSWFKGELDLEKIPQGDYDLYMKTIKNDYYAEEIVSNIFNKEIDRRAEDNTNGYNFKVQLSLKSKRIELNIRTGNLITTKTAPTFRNMVNNYENMEFVNNKLKVTGTSYNFNATYNDSSKITRKLILEDTTTYKRYTYDLGSVKDLNYKVESTDEISKAYAWYNKTIDLKNLPKGTYSMLVYTKTIDAEDYGEISDTFANVKVEPAAINGKKYSISLNKNRHNRIELKVE